MTAESSTLLRGSLCVKPDGGVFGGSVTQDRELILVAELADLDLARTFATALGADLTDADVDYGDGEFVG